MRRRRRSGLSQIWHPFDEETLKSWVRELLLANLSEGYSWLLGKHYCFVQPSPDTYPFQFWWDTCFHIFMLCRLGEYEVAKRNLRSLFAMQDENGFVGHMTFWKKLIPTHYSDVLQARPTLLNLRPHMSALIQPPLVAQALERIYRCTGDEWFLRDMLPKVKNYFQWLALSRDFEDHGLISIISPVESGMDFKPSYDSIVGYDRAKRLLELYWKAAIKIDGRNFLDRYNLGRIYKAQRFIIQDVLVNTFYVRDLRALARLCEETADASGSLFRDRADQTANAIFEHMFDEAGVAFFDTQGPDHRQLKTLTFTSLLPLLLPEVPANIAHCMIERHLLNAEEFQLSYPVPSLAASEPAFDVRESRFLWRGPTWAVANWSLFHGCRERGFDDVARRLRESLLQLVVLSGFREYYNPFTGEGYGARDFTWSGLIVDMV
jgi:glycogen debranching enzyme